MVASPIRKVLTPVILGFVMGLPYSGWAQYYSADAPREQSLISNILSGYFESQREYVRILPFISFEEPVSDQVADNSLVGISENRFEVDVRIDLKINPGMFKLMAKPRLDIFTEEEATSGDTDRENTVDVYFHEWSAGIQPVDSIAISYGQEDLQWGPSYLISPSNPFAAENGRNSPKTEVRAAEYAKLSWSPGRTSQTAFIVNTGKGRKKDYFDLFETVYAVKTDLFMDDIQASLIGSYRDDEVRVGYHWSYNLSDAVILYNEAGFESDDEEILGGASYTFENGPTIYVEYLYNGSGTKVEGMPPGSGQQQSGQFREALARKNYVLIQVNDPDLFDKLDLTLRYIANLDDNSALISLFADYFVGPYTKLFFNGTLFEGDDVDEFGQLLDYIYRAGLDFSF